MKKRTLLMLGTLLLLASLAHAQNKENPYANEYKAWGMDRNYRSDYIRLWFNVSMVHEIPSNRSDFMPHMLRQGMSAQEIYNYLNYSTLTREYGRAALELRDIVGSRTRDALFPNADYYAEEKGMQWWVAKEVTVHLGEDYDAPPGITVILEFQRKDTR